MARTKKSRKQQKSTTEAVAADVRSQNVDVKVETVAVAEGVSAPNVRLSYKLWKAFAQFPDTAGVVVPLGVKIIGRLCPEVVEEVVQLAGEKPAARLCSAMSSFIEDVKAHPGKYPDVLLRVPAQPRVSDGIKTLREIARVIRVKLTKQFRCDGLLYTAKEAGSFSLLDCVNDPAKEVALVYEGVDEGSGEARKRVQITFAWTGRVLRATEYKVEELSS